MISFTAFTPHPPIIIPGIDDKNIGYCHKTISAMNALAENISDKDVDTTIFISPHTTFSPDNIAISYNPEAAGDFSQFNHPEISFSSRVDLDLADQLINKAAKAKLPAKKLSHEDDFFLDHGVLVPYFYLKPEMPSSSQILVIGFSEASRAAHYAFGQLIADVAKSSDKNIAIIASGDLSHHNLDIGAEFIGNKFDKLITDNLDNKQAILNIPESLQEEAGECGYRSLLILLGALDSSQAKSRLLSYEAPFGVGYMVAEFETNQDF